MSAKDREMASILGPEDPIDRFQAVKSLIKPNASPILDLGCGRRACYVEKVAYGKL